jgi:hypothetical protein
MKSQMLGFAGLTIEASLLVKPKHPVEELNPILSTPLLARNGLCVIHMKYEYTEFQRSDVPTAGVDLVKLLLP